MPVIKRSTIRSRLADLLRSSAGREFSMADLARELGCDVSILPGHCRVLAEASPDVWFIEAASPGRPSTVYCARKRRA